MHACTEVHAGTIIIKLCQYVCMYACIGTDNKYKKLFEKKKEGDIGKTLAEKVTKQERLKSFCSLHFILFWSVMQQIQGSRL